MLNKELNYNNLPSDIHYLIYKQNRIDAQNRKYKHNYKNVIREINFFYNNIYYKNKDCAWFQYLYNKLSSKNTYYLDWWVRPYCTPETMEDN